MTVQEIKSLSLEQLIALGEFQCECGKIHSVGTKRVIIEEDAISRLPELIEECGAKKPFLLSGTASFQAAGDKVCSVLEQAGIPYTKYILPGTPVKPTEGTVGSAVMHFDPTCDLVIGIGSGVVNDTGKLLAAVSGRRYMIVGTAPSMDGFASATSSMDRDGLKVSLDSTFAWAVIGDVEILAQAPMRMLQAGVGDMLAKYISLLEWKIASILVDEYYCPVVAGLVENSLARIVEATPKLLQRDHQAVKAVMEGMVIAGMAMKYAGLSRPASGMEHYFSHIWDMRSLSFPEAQADLHGIQCGIATLYSLKVYEYIRKLTPDREKALAYVSQFDVKKWHQQLSDFVGEGSSSMIAAESREGKYDVDKHRNRLERILSRWDELMALVDELPSYDSVYAIMQQMDAPLSASVFGYTAAQIGTTFTMTKDIRDKYIASRLLWDLGELENAAAAIFQ